MTRCCEKFLNLSARTGQRFQELFQVGGAAGQPQAVCVCVSWVAVGVELRLGYKSAVRRGHHAAPRSIGVRAVLLVLCGRGCCACARACDQHAPLYGQYSGGLAIF